MKKFLDQNKKPLVFILSLLIVWRIVLLIPYYIAHYFLPQRPGFINQVPWANFDGIHYLSIAQNGYFQFEQAFFPLFPLLIKYVSPITGGDYVLSGLFIVNTALFIWLFLFYKLLVLDYKETVAKWTLVFYLFFPASFFFGSVYTETLFLLFVIGAFYAARREKWVLAGILVSLASSTKLIGIFLLPALVWEFYVFYNKKIFIQKRVALLSTFVVVSLTGLLAYMYYLWQVFNDPLLFVHAQPAFGANRSGGDIILLPQVIYRYFKIFLTVPFSNYDTWIALLEFSTMVVFLTLLCYGVYKHKFRMSYFIFALLAIVGPTLTGSLSSLPRYALIGFPVFILFGMIQSVTIKTMLFSFFAISLIVLAIFFLQGYFIA